MRGREREREEKINKGKNGIFPNSSRIFRTMIIVVVVQMVFHFIYLFTLYNRNYNICNSKGFFFLFGNYNICNMYYNYNICNSKGFLFFFIYFL